MKWVARTVLTVLMVFGLSTEAFAGGLEFPAPGTNALGRGGANYARPGDAMALMYNPANLAAESGLQLSFQTHLVLYDACVDRAGTYTSYEREQPADVFRGGADRTTETVNAIQQENASAFNDGVSYPNGELPRVCNSAGPGIVPQFVLTWRAHRMIGIGVGFLAPAGVANTQWGSTQRVGDRRYVGITDGLPSPTRYGLIRQSLIAGFPTIGLGFAPHPRVRFGLAFGSGFARAEFINMTRAVRGEDFANDIHTKLEATDRFLPRITASAHVVPHDNLDISATFVWTDDANLEGDLTLQSGYYRDAVLEELEISNVRLNIPQAWQLAFGIRYADRTAPRHENPQAVSQLSDRVEDSMSNERFDIEFDVVYERNSRVNRYDTTLPSNPDRDDGVWFIQADTGIPAAIPVTLPVEKQWKDSLSFRLGADWNAVPGFLAARLGLSYETKGVEGGYEQFDFMPFQRTGLHLGLTLRFGRFDLSVAYAHIWQTSVTVREGRGEQINADFRTTQINCENDAVCSAQDPEEQRRQAAEDSNFGAGTIVNAGRFTSNFDVLSLGLTYHFR
ncbi:MAG: hypothetical protein AAGE52_05680 [Myxococcota bacterium]